MKKRLLLAGLFLGGLVLVLVWIQGGFRSKAPGGHTSVEKKKVAPLRTIKVETSRSTGRVTVSGTVVSRETARIASRGQGYVIEINADAGDPVKKGQILLRIDNKEVAEREAQAIAALESAKADLVKARNDFQRFKALYEKESIAKREFDDATARYEMAKAAEQRAGAAVKEARTILSHGVVRAPFDGLVGERDVNPGDLVTPGRLLFTVFKPGTAELVAAVGEQYATHLKEGTPVTVTIPSIELEEKSTISEVVPQRDTRTRTITVKAPLSEAAGLGPGLYGTMSFGTKTSEMIVAPGKAIRVVGQLETVRILEEGAVRVRHVKTGRVIGENVEVLSGLSPGEKLIVE